MGIAGRRKADNPARPRRHLLLNLEYSRAGCLSAEGASLSSRERRGWINLSVRMTYFRLHAVAVFNRTSWTRLILFERLQSLISICTSWQKYPERALISPLHWQSFGYPSESVQACQTQTQLRNLETSSVLVVFCAIHVAGWSVVYWPPLRGTLVASHTILSFQDDRGELSLLTRTSLIGFCDGFWQESSHASCQVTYHEEDGLQRA